MQQPVPDGVETNFESCRIKSGFLQVTVVLEREALSRLLERTHRLIHPDKADNRCYRMTEHAGIKTLGRRFFPKDVMLFTGGVNGLLSGLQA